VKWATATVNRRLVAGPFHAKAGNGPSYKYTKADPTLDPQIVDNGALHEVDGGADSDLAERERPPLASRRALSHERHGPRLTGRRGVTGRTVRAQRHGARCRRMRNAKWTAAAVIVSACKQTSAAVKFEMDGS
jgi:hypothetical protein